MTKSIADKIRKIIAKADSTSNPEEAHTFMAKAQALLEAHGLSLLDIGRLDSDDPIGVDKNCAEVPGAYSSANTVANQLSIYYGCQLVQGAKRNGDNKKVTTFSVAGRESARITFQLMFPYVWRQVMALAREGFNSGGYSNRMQALNYVANALSLRLHRLNAEAEATRAAQPVGSGLNQLVPVNLVLQALEEAFPTMKEGRARTAKTNAKSRELASKVSFNRQASAPAGTLRLGGR